MRMYDLIMMNPMYRKEVLIKFGFGMVSPLKIERWFRENYPILNKRYKEDLKEIHELCGDSSDNVIPFKVESMTQQERLSLLNKLMGEIEEDNQELFDKH